MEETISWPLMKFASLHNGLSLQTHMKISTFLLLTYPRITQINYKIFSRYIYLICRIYNIKYMVQTATTVIIVNVIYK